MPSWNIHTGHVERLLSERGAKDLGIQDPNVFLFGNFVPDVYVGYMVPNTTYKINYLDTHFAEPSSIPLPAADEFARKYFRRGTDDLKLGVWAHLTCDHIYNQATREYLEVLGLEPGEDIRIRKQADFADYGRTFPIELRVQATPELIRAGQNFAQYTLLERDVRAAVEVANGIVDDNHTHHIQGVPDYRLLTEDFFLETFERVNDALIAGLHGFKG